MLAERSTPTMLLTVSFTLPNNVLESLVKSLYIVENYLYFSGDNERPALFPHTRNIATYSSNICLHWVAICLQVSSDNGYHSYVKLCRAEQQVAYLPSSQSTSFKIHPFRTVEVRRRKCLLLHAAPSQYYTISSANSSFSKRGQF